MTENEHGPKPAEGTTPLTILVVASDPKLLKLLDMALSLEFACQVLTMKQTHNAEETAKRSKPALFILDEEWLNDKTHHLSARLHRIPGLEQRPTLFLNAAVPSQNEQQSYPTCFLEPSWKVEALYAAVRTLLAQTS